MDPSLLRRVRAATVKIVKRASRPDGPLDRGEFTISIARQEIAAELGLRPDGLDKWKKEIKAEVQRALVRLFIASVKRARNVDGD